MNKEKYSRILDEAYRNYFIKVDDINPWQALAMKRIGAVNLSQKEFIHQIKLDPEFSSKWDLKIEERELSLEERKDIRGEEWLGEFRYAGDGFIKELLDNDNVPTKLITLTYKGKTIEVYE
jgi:hypothetical protein